MRRSPVLSTLGFLLAPIGLILLATQVVRVVGYDATLNTLGTVLLWAGVGALAVGLLLLALTVTDDAPRPAAAAPADDAPAPAPELVAEGPGGSEPARPVQSDPVTQPTEPVPAAAAVAPEAGPPAPEAGPVAPEGSSSLERLRRHAAADEPTDDGSRYAGPADSEPSDPSAG